MLHLPTDTFPLDEAFVSTAYSPPGNNASSHFDAIASGRSLAEHSIWRVYCRFLHNAMGALPPIARQHGHMAACPHRVLTVGDSYCSARPLRSFPDTIRLTTHNHNSNLETKSRAR